jgi:porphobilinogen deaminase
MDGAIFAAAGMLRPGFTEKPDRNGCCRMLPAPRKVLWPLFAGRTRRDADASAPLHHHHTAVCTTVERDFIMMGGCSALCGIGAGNDGTLTE